MRSAVMAAVIALTASCTAPAPVADPSLAPIILGQRAVRPVPAFGSVWIASAAEGTVQRVDAKTGAIIATITVADPQRLLAAGCAPSSEHAYATGSFGLRARDAPSAVAAGAGAIWAVANDTNAIVRLDPVHNAVTDTVALGFNAWAVTATDGAVWVSDYASDALVRVDPDSRRVVARITVPSGPTEIAIAGDDVWVRGGSARADGGLYRIDARTNTATLIVQAGAPQGREGVASIAATDRGVWVPGISLDLVDRATGAIAATLPVSSYAVAVDGGTLWVLNVFGRLERRAAPR